MSTPVPALTRKQARTLLWNKGILTFLLDSTQKHLYDSYVHANSRTIVWACSRRLGKSYTLCVIAIEKCLSKPNAIVKICSPTQKMIKSILNPLFREILKDCPDELRPHFRTQDSVYRFHNGSEIQLAGTDSGNAENLRGGQADLCIVDEAGFCDQLEYVVQSILIPTMTTTGGKVILASTPPISPDHEFVTFKESAQIRNAYTVKTIYDNPRLNEAMIASIQEEVGVNSIQFRREYLCHFVKDEKLSVVPEFDEELKKDIVKEWVRPPYFDGYVAMDLGLKDLTVVLFAYRDFLQDKLVIEDEFVLNGRKMNTDYLAKGIKAKEAALYTSPLTHDFQKPYLRVSDNNLIVINDLRVLHQLEFIPTQKDNSDAALNNMRVMLESKKIIIHPRCTTLIRHLQNAVWTKSRTTFARSLDDGHYDAVDALKYLVRNVQWNRNPYPRDYQMVSGEYRMVNPYYKKPDTQAAALVKRMFNVDNKPRRK